MIRVEGTLGPGGQKNIHPCLGAGLYLGPLFGVGRLTDLDIQIKGGLGNILGKYMLGIANIILEGLNIEAIGNLARKPGKDTTLLVVL